MNRSIVRFYAVLLLLIGGQWMSSTQAQAPQPAQPEQAASGTARLSDVVAALQTIQANNAALIARQDETAKKIEEMAVELEQLRILVRRN
ncbi:MAG: hypothetical protein ACFCU3_05620 [Verrucomicrobiales bacterium]